MPSAAPHQPNATVARTGALLPDPSNLRQVDTGAPEFAALVESIGRDGIIEPIVVRPDGMIICGHRRHAAAEALGLEEVPIVVRQASDDEIRAIRIVENMHRQDLTPIEESDAFVDLLAAGMSAEEIAIRSSVSLATIRRRLKLQDLPEIARQALRAGKITTFAATAIANIPNAKMQEEALQIAAEGQYRGGVAPSDNEFSRIVKLNFMLRIKGAPFDTTSAELDPIAGPCSSCPKNTACDLVLFDFATEDKDGLCTDVQCFERKTNITTSKRLDAAKAKGIAVIEPTAGPKEEEKLAKWFNFGRLAYNSPWIDANQIPPAQGTGKKTIKTLLGKDAPPLTVLVDPATQIAHDVFDSKDAWNALAAKFDWAKDLADRPSSISPAEKKKREKERDDKKVAAIVETQIANRATEALTERLKQIPSCPVKVDVAILLRILCISTLGDDIAKKLMKHYGIEKADDVRTNTSTVAQFIAGMDLAQMVRFAFSQVIFQILTAPFGNKDHKAELGVALLSMGIDVAEITELARADIQVDAKERKKRKEGSAKAKGGTINATLATTTKPSPKKKAKTNATAKAKKASNKE